jgi:RHS repeat-associated protein
VGSLEISPQGVTLRVGESFDPIAIARDGAGQVLHGVAVRWTASSADGEPVPVDATGRFRATQPGVFLLRADSASGHSAVVIVTVQGGDATSSPSPGGNKRNAFQVGTNVMAATTQQAGDPSYDPGIADDVFLPTNQRRTMPNEPLAPSPARPQRVSGAPHPRQVDDLPTAGVGEMTFDMPLLSSNSRGLDTSLTLYYSAKVWTIGSTTVHYDVDGDWPAPGFTLSLGKAVVLYNDVVFIDPSGTRHQLWKSTAYQPSGTFTGWAKDGSLLQYSVLVSGGYPKTLTVWYPNGTQLDFGAGSSGALYVTRVTDPNGNFLRATYVGNVGPELAVIQDTMGRNFAFNYDANANLASITGPGLSGTTRTYAQFHYSPKQITGSFDANQFVGGVFINGGTGSAANTRWLLDAVLLPDGTGYSMGPLAAFYSTYGMVKRLDRRSNISIDATGAVVQGTLLGYTWYDFPDVGSPALTSAPTYTERHDWWTSIDTPSQAEAVTKIGITTATGSRTTTMTLPDGSKMVRVMSDVSPDRGLTKSVSIYGPNGALNRVTTYTYVNTFMYTRLVGEEMVEDFGAGASAPRRTVYVYRSAAAGDPTSSQIAEIQEYDFDKTTLLRRTVLTHVTDPGYLANHVMNLVKSRQVLDGTGTVFERTDFAYDAQRGTALVDPPLFNHTPLGSVPPAGSVLHDSAYDPYAPQQCTTSCHQECDPSTRPPTCIRVCDPPVCVPRYQPATDFRGNVSSVTRYAAPATAGGPLVTTFSYDILGNVVDSTDEGGIHHHNVYSDALKYAYLTSSTAGTGVDASVTQTTYYDYGTGLVTGGIDEAGRSSSLEYRPGQANPPDTLHPDSLRLRKVTLPTGAYAEVTYDDVTMTTRTVTKDPAGARMSEQSVQFNGQGNPHTTSTIVNVSTVDIVQTVYDALGRPSKQSLPYRSGATPQFIEVSYDGVGRQTAVKGPDGATSTWTYQPVVIGPGQASVGITVVQSTPWGAETSYQYNALGQLIAAREAKNASGPTAQVRFSPGVLSTYTYDVLGNLLTISAYSYDATGALVNQPTSGRRHTFAYDGLGRIVAQKLGERDATLNGAGAYVGTASGTYSDVMLYDGLGRIDSKVDARGVRTKFNYAGDPLGRLSTVSYIVDPSGDTAAHAIAPAAAVTYSYCSTNTSSGNYCPHRDVRMVKSESSADVTRTYTFDAFGRTTAAETKVASRPGYPFLVQYAYDVLGRATSMVYPKEYGFGSASQKTFAVALDLAGRTTALKQVVSPTVSNPFAQSISYAPTGGMTQATIGYGSYSAVTNWSYEPVSGLVQHQDVTPSGQPKALDLDYGYTVSGLTGRTGKLTSILNKTYTNGSRDRQYVYDSLGRLATMKGGVSSWSESYSYDDAGNRLKVTPTSGATPDGVTSALTYDAQNRIAGFEYDAAGNLYQGKVDGQTIQRFQYDAAGRLVKVWKVVMTGTSALSGPSASFITGGEASGPIGDIPGDPVCTGSPSCRLSNGCTGSRECTDPPIWGPCELDTTSHRGCTNACGATGSQTCNLDGTFGTCNVTSCCAGYGGACSLSNGCGGTVACDGSCTPNGDAAQGGQPCQLPNGCGGVKDCNGTCVALAGTTNAAACTNPVGAPGHENCTSAGTYVGCLPDDPSQRVEVCNGQDDDGDGLVDNAPGAGPNTLSRSCTNSCGTAGAQTCTNGTWGTCSGCTVTLTLLESYTYGVSRDRLVSTDAASSTRTYYVRGGSGVIAEYKDTGAGVIPTYSRQYVYLNGSMLASLKPSGTSEVIEWYHTDRLGIRLLATTTTSVKENVTLPFGSALISESTGSTNYAFTTYDRSSVTKLDYAQNRYYSSAIGRFTQVDPTGRASIAAGSCQSFNLYAYASNDPISMADPSGLVDCEAPDCLVKQWEAANGQGGGGYGSDGNPAPDFQGQAGGRYTENGEIIDVVADPCIGCDNLLPGQPPSNPTGPGTAPPGGREPRKTCAARVFEKRFFTNFNQTMEFFEWPHDHVEVTTLGGLLSEVVLGEKAAAAVGGFSAWQAIKGFGYIGSVGAAGLAENVAFVDFAMSVVVKGAVKGVAAGAALGWLSLNAGVGIGSALESAFAMPQVPLDQWGPNAPALCAQAGGGGGTE